jgi:HlyD family secretion protein
MLMVLLLLGLLGGGAAWYINNLQHKQETAIVLHGNIDVRQVNLAFKVPGRIVQLAVDEGDRVKAGQVLASLEKSYFEDEIRLARARVAAQEAVVARLENGSRPEEITQAKAVVAERRATLVHRQRSLARSEQLAQSHAVSRQELDNDRAAVEEAEARLQQAQDALRLLELGPRTEEIAAARAQLDAENAALIEAERRLSDSQLLAPSEGVILTRVREAGAIVAAGETVFTLTLNSPVWVRTYVAEPDLGKVYPGMPATVTTDTAPDRPYPGQVGFISPVAEFTPKPVETRELRTDLVYRLRIVVENPDAGLRQGMPVTVTLPLKPARD